MKKGKKRRKEVIPLDPPKNMPFRVKELVTTISQIFLTTKKNFVSDVNLLHEKNF